MHIKLTFDGKPCCRCGSTLRFVKTRRCIDCQRRYTKQHKNSVAERDRMRGQPCELCGDSMDQPCFDEVDGTLRGWLCHHCNIGLGQFRDSRHRLRQAINYLDRKGS